MDCVRIRCRGDLARLTQEKKRKLRQCKNEDTKDMKQIHTTFDTQKQTRLDKMEQELQDTQELMRRIGSGCECRTDSRYPFLEEILLECSPTMSPDVAWSIASYCNPVLTPAKVLSVQQLLVLDAIRQGRSIFFTGKAGTGKSQLLKKLRHIADQHLPCSSIYFTAMTGVAALHIKGMTLHFFAGLGLGEGSKETLLKGIYRNKKAKAHWANVEVLVIDEISMMDGILFSKLDWIARQMKRRHTIPFGGVQLILCGDFYQLPPVRKHCYCFQTESWKQLFFAPQKQCFTLTQVFRQRDPILLQLLEEFRHGATISEQSLLLLKDLERPLCCHGEVQPTRLFPLNKQVEEENKRHYDALPDERELTYYSQDQGDTKKLANLRVKEEITLKCGTQVMLLRNTLFGGANGVDIPQEEGGEGEGRGESYFRDGQYHEVPHVFLANGSVGVVVDFVTDHEPPPEEEVAPRVAPRVLEHIDALRVTFQRLGEDRLFIDRDEWRRAFPNLQPLVKFMQGGVGGGEVLVPIARACFKIEKKVKRMREGKQEEVMEVEAQRTQYPLCHAWAITIHKAQGLTLDKLSVCLDRVFERAQAYVALSRTSSLRTLHVAPCSPALLKGKTLDLLIVQFDQSIHRFPLYVVPMDRETSFSRANTYWKQAGHITPRLPLPEGLEEEE